MIEAKGIKISEDKDPISDLLFHHRAYLKELFSNPHLKPEYKRYLQVSFTARDSLSQKVGGLVGLVSFDYGYIEVVWVDSKVQGQNIGKTLVEEFERRVQALNCQRVQTVINSYDQSLGFWTKLGYSVFHELPSPARDFSIQYLQKIF
ncbi:MAG: GNAT family N-acetyltransferase [Bdellovibrionales bacterium]